MIAPRHAQRGAITLVGALFIVVVLSVMAAALLRMAGSNILDTAVHNDALEALFVAETGVEHASYLYASTANCLGLAGVGPVNAGRGSFTLTNAVVQPGGDCRVRVAASVGSAPNTAPAVRTVDADLRLGGGNEGWIVGDNGTILQWDGVTWNAVASPTTEDLFDVHCSNASDCKAVGAGGTIIHWNGTNWSNVASSTNVNLFAVSCEPNNPGNCFASGGTAGFIAQGIIQHWDGTSWSDQVNIFAFFADWRFNDLACPSNTCYVVTANGVIGRFDTGSGNWVDDTSNTTVPQNGIACTADDYCWSVGDISGANWNFDFRNSIDWTPSTQGVGAQARVNLNAVSCVDSSNCWAVGDRRGNHYVLGYWDGSNWSEDISVGTNAQRENLNAVHCLVSGECWAVGDYQNTGNVIYFDGANWAYIGAAVANNTDLNGVHFPAGGGGGSTITLTRWEEIIGN